MLRTPQYTTEQRVFMVNHKTKGDPYKAIKYDFKKCFPLSGRDPARSVILNNKKKFDKEGKLDYCFWNIIKYIKFYLILGTVLNLNKGRSGPKPSVLTVDRLQMMQDMIEGIYILAIKPEL